MVVLEWITAVLLLIGVGMPGVMKLMKHSTAVEAAKHLQYENMMMPIGIAEVLGAIAVIIGAAASGLEWLGVLAALGIAGLMVGALYYHRKAGDTKEMAPAAILLVVAVVYIIALFAN